MQEKPTKRKFDIMCCFMSQLHNIYLVAHIEIEEDCLRTWSLVVGKPGGPFPNRLRTNIGEYL